MNDSMTFEKPSSRLSRAIERARLAIEDLRLLGVHAKLVGSLARGSFNERSDVDFLVVSCPAHLKYAIEGSVEDRMADIPFDVIYLDEIPTSKLERFTRGAVDASCLL
jgi:predicted nucleotidyltransferase